MSRGILLIAGVIFFLLLTSSKDFGGTLGILFIGGLWGLIAIANKGYLTGVSIILWLLFGWWFLAILLLGGPFTLFIAALLPERKRCIHCKSYISKDATRCPKCQGSLSQ